MICPMEWLNVAIHLGVLQIKNFIDNRFLSHYKSDEGTIKTNWYFNCSKVDSQSS